jgi:hypothetical protein
MLFPHCQRLEGELSADLPHRSASFSRIGSSKQKTVIEREKGARVGLMEAMTTFREG